MIYVTHKLTEVFTLADWVLMIRQGKLVAQGVPKQALGAVNLLAQLPDDQFENVFTARLLDSDRAAGTSRVRLDSGHELLIPHTDAPVNSPLQIRVSADDIIIATEMPRGLSAGNILAGEIQRFELADGEAMLTVRAGADFSVSLTAAAVRRLGLKEGAAVFLIIKTRSFRAL